MKHHSLQSDCIVWAQLTLDITILRSIVLFLFLCPTTVTHFWMIASYRDISNSTDHMILKIPMLLLLSVSVQTRAPGTNCTWCPKDNCTEWPILLYRVSHITVKGVKNNTITQKICKISSDFGLFVSILRTKYLFLVNFNNFEHLVHVQ